MSWSYSGDPSRSKLDEIRFLIGDTNIDEPIMQDEEIKYLVDNSSSELELKYNVFSRTATLFARDIKRTLGPQSEDPTGRLDYFKAQAASYKKQLYAAGISLPNYNHPKVFHIGMQNNPPWPGPK